MNRDWRSVQLGDVARIVAEYRPYLLTILAVVVITVVLPGARDTTGVSTFDAPTETGAPGPAAFDAPGTSSSSGAEPSGAAASTVGAAGASAGGAPGAPAGSSAAGAVVTPSPAVSVNPSADPLAAPDCDRERARIKVPALAAPCVPLFSGDNGGSTYQGVTAEEIVVAVYEPQTDPQSEALLAAAGVSDTNEQLRQQYLDWVEYFQAHYETYGRKVRVEFVGATGTADDEAAGRADAVRIATEIKAFAVWTLVESTAFIDELASRGVLVFPYYAGRNQTYIDLAPFVWTSGAMSFTQLYTHAAEYVGKRVAGRTAAFAGQPDLQLAERKLGLLFVESANGAAKAEADAFEQQLSSFGASLTARASFTFDYGTIQEQSRTIMSRFREKGVSTIILATDFLSPIFLTQAATSQGYFPEWVVTGSAFTDLNFYGRLYDQAQWQHAFGLSAFGVRYPKHLGPCDLLYAWHYNRPPPAEASYCVLLIEQSLLFLGIHLAGPNLNPGTFRDAIWSMPAAGGAYEGKVLGPGASFGRKGVWPFDDYVGWDDTAEVWWNPVEQGADELGNDGSGMYMYAKGGQRFLPGGHPAGDTAAFVADGAVSWLDELPPNETPPQYECRTRSGQVCPSAG